MEIFLRGLLNTVFLMPNFVGCEAFKLLMQFDLTIEFYAILSW